MEYKSKYLKYKKKYIDLKNLYGGSIRRSQSQHVPDMNDDIINHPIRAASMTDVDNVPWSTCTEKRDPITLVELRDIPPNNLIELEYGKCYDIITLQTLPNNNDPMTNIPFSNEILHKIRNKIVGLGLAVPLRLNNLPPLPPLNNYPANLTIPPVNWQHTQPFQGQHFNFINNLQLKNAAELWCIDEPHALHKYGNISEWDTSNITDMSGLFENEEEFNDNISRWNTSRVTNMSNMFHSYEGEFDQDINTKLVDVNGNVYIAWDTSNVTNMASMFNGCYFNKNIDNWNTSNVIDMSRMFQDSSFNLDINTKLVNVNDNPYIAWNTSNVINMSFMFYGKFAFDHNIDNWNTTNVTDMSRMFTSLQGFNRDISRKPINIGDLHYEAWDTRNVRTMVQMFAYCMNFNADIGNWNVQNVRDMKEMFKHAPIFNKNLNNWDTSSVINMQAMFYQAGAFNPNNIQNWNLDNVDTFNMFESNQAQYRH
jgi:surface protein